MKIHLPFILAALCSTVHAHQNTTTRLIASNICPTANNLSLSTNYNESIPGVIAAVLLPKLIEAGFNWAEAEAKAASELKTITMEKASAATYTYELSTSGQLIPNKTLTCLIFIGRDSATKPRTESPLSDSQYDKYVGHLAPIFYVELYVDFQSSGEARFLPIALYFEGKKTGYWGRNELTDIALALSISKPSESTSHTVDFLFKKIKPNMLHEFIPKDHDISNNNLLQSSRWVWIPPLAKSEVDLKDSLKDKNQKLQNLESIFESKKEDIEKRKDSKDKAVKEISAEIDTIRESIDYSRTKEILGIVRFEERDRSVICANNEKDAGDLKDLCNLRLYLAKEEQKILKELHNQKRKMEAELSAIDTELKSLKKEKKEWKGADGKELYCKTKCSTLRPIGTVNIEASFIETEDGSKFFSHLHKYLAATKRGLSDALIEEIPANEDTAKKDEAAKRRSADLASDKLRLEALVASNKVKYSELLLKSKTDPIEALKLELQISEEKAEANIAYKKAGLPAPY